MSALRFEFIGFFGHPLSLARRGWIEEADNASWRIRIVDGASPARNDLSAIDQRTMRRIAELFANIETLVARP